MTTGIALYYPRLRYALRERLVSCIDIDAHAPGASVTLAQSGGKGVFTRASGSWLAAGFASGQEVTVGGFTGSPLIGVAERVSALALVTNIAGSQTVAGGGAFSVKLPGANEPNTAIAWEGDEFTPQSGKPYVVESLRAGPTLKRSHGGGALIEHRSTAAFTLHYPRRGTNAIERMAGALLAHFLPGDVSLSREGMRASIQSASRTPLYFDGSWVSCAVTVDLLSWTQG